MCVMRKWDQNHWLASWRDNKAHGLLRATGALTVSRAKVTWPGLQFRNPSLIAVQEMDRNGNRESVRWAGHWVGEGGEDEDCQEGNDHEDGQEGTFQGPNWWAALTLRMTVHATKPDLVASFSSLLIKKVFPGGFVGIVASFLTPFWHSQGKGAILEHQYHWWNSHQLGSVLCIPVGSCHPLFTRQGGPLAEME